MKNKYTVIDTAGQYTPVFVGYSGNRTDISKRMLEKYPKAGQVGFVQQSSKYPSRYDVEMMGGELSINGSLACSYVISKIINKSRFRVNIASINSLVEVNIQNNYAEIAIPRYIAKVSRNQVDLEGISYCFINNIPNSNIIDRRLTTTLNKLISKSPAGGIVFYDDNKIVPVIKVKATNTIIWETACGSASLAYFLLTGKQVMVQPSGKDINVRNNRDKLIMGTGIREIT